MKKLIILICALFGYTGTHLLAQDMVISGALDGPLSGGTPKAVEFYVINTISDLSEYGFGSANNGMGSDGEEFSFPSQMVEAGTYLYLSTETENFNLFFGFEPDFLHSCANINGDDALELFFQGNAVDVFGDINVDGTGESWEYLDGWAYRENQTGPDGTEFQLEHWSFSGPNALDDEVSNGSAVYPWPLGSYQHIGSPPDPEPTNYPENFSAEISDYIHLNLSWMDPEGDVLPESYILLGAKENDFELPVDGVPIIDDFDFSDGNISININYGVESYLCEFVEPDQTYFFTIYPYVNSNELIDYKTDENAPLANINVEDVHYFFEGFNEGLGAWSQYSVMGDEQLWTLDEYEGEYFVSMSGYETSFFENEDWLISPRFIIEDNDLCMFSFYSATNYEGPGLELLISSDYIGWGDPNLANWEVVETHFSSGDWQWEFSDYIDILQYSNLMEDDFYLAFKYVSTELSAACWEIDETFLVGDISVSTKMQPEIEIQVYPNPADQYVIIDYKQTIKKVEIIDIMGNSVFLCENNLSEQKLNISNLNTGIYLMLIIDHLNQRCVKKLIIK
ncbi:MAG: T9SS type A sorting domain-containing protein [Bacteroidales bacterium]|nr:T9SS type A sorting domain-containing protein [Bacteroidales bacterium]